jgi:hypothetical protein
MESGLDIEYLRNYIQGLAMIIEPDIRHNLIFEEIEPHLTNGIYYEPEYYPYLLVHKNTNRPLKIRKVYPPVINQENTDYRSNFKKNLSRSKFTRFRKIYDIFGDELAQIRYRMTEAFDVIEQLPMIKLIMMAHMSFDYIEYRITSVEEDEYDPRVEFRFWFYDPSEDLYSKEVIISVDHGVLFGHDNRPIIADSTDPSYHTIGMFESIVDTHDAKRDNDLKLVSKNNKLNKIHLFHLLIKALILVTNLLDIDLQRANLNSYIAAIRGGRLYRLEIDPSIDIDKVDLNLKDVKSRGDELDIIHSIWVADNILDTLSTIKNNGIQKKLTKRKPTLSSLSEMNRSIRSEKICQKRIPVPYSPYSIMIKNLFESDSLLGITAGNTFLYIVDSLEVDNSGDLQILFLNPIRGNTIRVSIRTVLSGMRRMGLILDRDVLRAISNIKK